MLYLFCVELLFIRASVFFINSSAEKKNKKRRNVFLETRTRNQTKQKRRANEPKQFLEEATQIEIEAFRTHKHKITFADARQKSCIGWRVAICNTNSQIDSARVSKRENAQTGFVTHKPNIFFRIICFILFVGFYRICIVCVCALDGISTYIFLFDCSILCSKQKATVNNKIKNRTRAWIVVILNCT